METEIPDMEAYWPFNEAAMMVNICLAHRTVGECSAQGQQHERPCRTITIPQAELQSEQKMRYYFERYELEWESNQGYAKFKQAQVYSAMDVEFVHAMPKMPAPGKLLEWGKSLAQEVLPGMPVDKPVVDLYVEFTNRITPHLPGGNT